MTLKRNCLSFACIIAALISLQCHLACAEGIDLKEKRKTVREFVYTTKLPENWVRHKESSSHVYYVWPGHVTIGKINVGATISFKVEQPRQNDIEFVKQFLDGYFKEQNEKVMAHRKQELEGESPDLQNDPLYTYTSNITKDGEEEYLFIEANVNSHIEGELVILKSLLQYRLSEGKLYVMKVQVPLSLFKEEEKFFRSLFENTEREDEDTQG